MPLFAPTAITRLLSCWRSAPSPTLAPQLPVDAWDGVPREAANVGRAAAPGPMPPAAPRPTQLSLDAVRQGVAAWHARLLREPGAIFALEALQEPEHTLAGFAEQCVVLQVQPELREAALPALRALLALRDSGQRAHGLTQLSRHVLASDGAHRDAFLTLMERDAGAKPGVLAAHLMVVLAGQGALLAHPHVRHTLGHRAVQHDGRTLTALVGAVQAWCDAGGPASLEDWLTWPNHSVLEGLLTGRMHAQQAACDPLVLELGPDEAAARPLLAALRDLQETATVRAAHARAVRGMLPSFQATRALNRYRGQVSADNQRLQRWLRRVDQAIPGLGLAEQVDLHAADYDAAGRRDIARALQRTHGAARALLSLLSQNAAVQHGLAAPAVRSLAEPPLFGAGSGAEATALQRFYGAEVAPMQRLLMQVGPGLMRLHGGRLSDAVLSGPAQLQGVLRAWLFPGHEATEAFAARVERLLTGLRDPAVLYRYVAWMDKLDWPGAPRVLRAVLAAQLAGDYHGYRHDHSPQLQHALKRAGRQGPKLRAAWEGGAEAPAHSVLATGLPRSWRLRDTAALDDFLHGSVDVDSCQNPLQENDNNAGLVGRMSDGSKRQLVVLDDRGVQQGRAMFRLLTPQRGRPVLLVSVPYVGQACSEAHKRDLHAVLWRYAHVRAQALGLRCVRGTTFVWPGLPRVAVATTRLYARPSAAPDYWDERDGTGLWSSDVEVYVTDQGRPDLLEAGAT